MKKLPTPQWFWATRSIGAFVALYEVLLDHGSERGTIILAAFGVMGFDYVAKRERGGKESK
jgi:hypothetical protein